MIKPKKLESTNSSNPANRQVLDKYNNKKVANKSICPFACPTCQSLGGDLVKSKYEIVNILSDTGDSIFSPMHEQYHDDDYENHGSRIRNSGGKVFLSADLVADSFFQQQKSKK